MRQNTYSIFSLLALVGIICYPQPLFASKPFVIGDYNTIRDGVCARPSAILAGSRIFLEIVNRNDEPLTPRTDGWPKGYSLEAALDLPPNQPFLQTVGLIDSLYPTPFLGRMNISEQKFLISSYDKVDAGFLNLKYFEFSIPLWLAGHNLSIRARYQTAEMDVYTSQIPRMWIDAPCDRADTAHVIASYIALEFEKNNHERVVQLADSMLSLGLSDAAGLDLARRSACEMKHWTKAIVYLDRLYADFGVVQFNAIDYPGHIRPDPNFINGAAEFEMYQSLRSNLISVLEKRQH